MGHNGLRRGALLLDVLAAGTRHQLALPCLPVPRAQGSFLNCCSKYFPVEMLQDGVNGINSSFPLLLEV